MSPSIPTTIAEYQVIRQLGAGGMGRVFLVKHPSLGVERVLKQILPEHAGNADLVRRFMTEARAVAKLHHPNVVVVHDFRTDADGQPFIVLEYLRGVSVASFLATWVARATAPVPPGMPSPPCGLSLGLVVIILGQTAAALTATHAIGLIHRDIKPDNLFLVAAPDNQRAALVAAGTPTDIYLKILDFGIARVTAEQGLTGTGVGIGTPEYMSPEQIEGRGVSSAADQYSCGAMVYQLLTGGSVPWGAQTPAAQIYYRQKSEPPLDPRTIEPSISVEVADVVRRAMAPNPADRWPSVAAFARALAAVTPAADGLPSGRDLLMLYAREIADAASAPTQLAIESLPATDALPPEPQAPSPTTLGSSVGSRELTPALPSAPVPSSRRGLAIAGGALVAVAAIVTFLVVRGGGASSTTASVPAGAVPVDASVPDAAPVDAAPNPIDAAPAVDAASPDDAAPLDAPKRKHRPTPGASTGTTIHPI